MDEVAWLEIVLTEFPIFTKAFTETVFDALKRLRGTGRGGQTTAQEVLSMPEVKKALEEDRNNHDWQTSSADLKLRIPEDVRAMIAGDKRAEKERAEYNEKFQDAARLTEEARKKALKDIQEGNEAED